MNMGTYASVATDHARELIKTLSGKDVEELRAKLNGTTTSGWREWRRLHDKSAQAYILSPPAARLRRQRWKVDRLLLTLSAINLCQEAANLLRVIDAHMLEPGGEYRQMTVQAGKAYFDLMGGHPPLWPFDDNTPFADED